MISFDFDNMCCGCGACIANCPTHAIRFTINKEGFKVPYVDDQECISCGKCEQKCPVLNAENIQHLSPVKVLSVCLKNEDDLKNSASGGVAYGMAKLFCEEGVVAGVAWNSKLEAEYIISDSLQGVKEMRGSKYVQAFIGESIEKVGTLLNQGVKVLFFGTPCQISGLVSSVGHPENLMTCGIICEGVASPQVWEVYKRYLERKKQDTLTKVLLRSKCCGWIGGASQYFFSKGKVVTKRCCFSLDPYISGFIEGLYNRPSCKKCEFKGIHEDVDFLIGDCWGATSLKIKENKNKGLSTLIICSKNGLRFWNEKCASDFFVEDESYRVVVDHNNIEHSGHWAKNRDIFFERVFAEGENSFDTLVWECAEKKWKKKLMGYAEYLHIISYIRMLKRRL